jgi:hypothetical protein
MAEFGSDNLGEWSAILSGLPFDGGERAMWALCVEGRRAGAARSSLDLFGLAEYPTALHERIDWLEAGTLAYVLRGQDRTLAGVLEAADRWWSRYRGIVLRGRPRGTGIYASSEEFAYDLKQAVAEVRSNGGKVTQETVAERLRTTDRQLRKWLQEHGIAWREAAKG